MKRFDEGSAPKGGDAGQQTADAKTPNYEQPETVRIGKIEELTQGQGTASLDGPYGPGWQKYED